MKLSKAGQVLKGPFFLNKRSEGASFCLATHPRQQRTPFLTSHAEGKKKREGNGPAANSWRLRSRIKKVNPGEAKWCFHFIFLSPSLSHFAASLLFSLSLSLISRDVLLSSFFFFLFLPNRFKRRGRRTVS